MALLATLMTLPLSLVLLLSLFTLFLFQPIAAKEDQSNALMALALQGGGIRALASDAGLLAGLARVHQEHFLENRAVNVTAVTAMLEHFDLVSSVSGSSWFAAEFFFSSSFMELLTGIED